MKETFDEYVRKRKLFSKKDKILAAVSGGIDSVVMLHLLIDSGYNAGVAHCNFGLRRKESDDDEEFVKALAEKKKLPFYSVHFDAGKIAKQKGVSVQMAARDLRYNWLERTRKDKKYNMIAVAHQSDDSIETFFINLIRGTGIAGLHGIKAKSGKIVRPLLLVSRKEIEDFAKRNNIKYREDSSNYSDKYMRNKIRHHLIPLLKELNPSVEKAINSAVERLNGVEDIFQSTVKKAEDKIVRKKNSVVSLDISLLLKLPHPELFLYEFVKPFGFSGDVVDNMISASNAEAGKVFYSPTYRMVRDRKHFLISPIEKKSGKLVLEISEEIKLITSPVKLKFSIKKNHKEFILTKNSTTACLDFDKLKFPLIIRKWTAGDFFYPFGMKGKKKLSDLFNDLKLSMIEKENIWLLCSGEDIVWVVGCRIDDRYRISDKTKRIYMSTASYLTKH